MSDEKSYQERLANVTKTLQIISAAMLLGIVIFMTIALVLNPQENKNWTLSLIMAGAGISTIAASFVVPKLIASQGTQVALEKSRDSNEKYAKETSLLQVHQSQLIIALALVEGGALANGIGYLLSGNYLNIGIMILGVLLIAMKIPTIDRVEYWIKGQIQGN